MVIGLCSTCWGAAHDQPHGDGGPAGANPRHGCERPTGRSRRRRNCHRRGGNLHLKKAAFRGSFDLHGDGVTIHGSQLLVLNGVLDQSLSGPVAGRFIVTAEINGRPTTIWEGAIHGVVNALIFTGRAIAHGEGPYAGQKLLLEFRERPATPSNPNPEVFDLTGFMTRRD